MNIIQLNKNILFKATVFCFLTVTFLFLNPKQIKAAGCYTFTTPQGWAQFYCPTYDPSTDSGLDIGFTIVSSAPNDFQWGYNSERGCEHMASGGCHQGDNGLWYSNGDEGGPAPGDPGYVASVTTHCNVGCNRLDNKPLGNITVNVGETFLFYCKYKVWWGNHGIVYGFSVSDSDYWDVGYSLLGYEGGWEKWIVSILGTFPSNGWKSIWMGSASDGVGLSCGGQSPIRVNEARPWWQVTDGDVTAAGNIISQMPTAPARPYFINAGAGGYPGVVKYFGGLSLGSGTLSTTKWQVNSVVTSKKSYNYNIFYGRVAGEKSIVWNTIENSNIDGSVLDSGGEVSPDGYYYYIYTGTDALTLNSQANLGDRKAVLFIEKANLNLNAGVRLTKGHGFFAVFVGEDSDGNGGDINIAATLGQEQGATEPDLEGLYYCDGSVYTNTVGGIHQDNWIYLRGALAVKGGLNLQRDGKFNGTYPAEYFEYAPDLIALFPNSLKSYVYKWQEVAP